ncbi:unnamed protein product [Timema podura]|uniref:Cytochrome P450 n=1 Tax=Timema podura TaxID=61482 RepID=A0ABN7P2D2_TIMPD|nr:unnamed protein product [Timema podura]
MIIGYHVSLTDMLSDLVTTWYKASISQWTELPMTGKSRLESRFGVLRVVFPKWLSTFDGFPLFHYANEGDIWRTHRKLIAPAFHLNVLKSFMNQLNNNSRILVKRLDKEVNGKAFDVHEYAAEITVDMLLGKSLDQRTNVRVLFMFTFWLVCTCLETVMGVSRKDQDASTYDYAMAVMRLCDIIHQRSYKIWLQVKSINNTIGFGKEEAKLLSLIHSLTNKFTHLILVVSIFGTLGYEGWCFKFTDRYVVPYIKVFNAKKEEYLKHKKAGTDRKIVDVSDPLDASTKGTYFDQTRGLKDDLDDDVGKMEAKV